MILCLLGVLKAGAAYVPLDRALPKERLGVILDDCQVAAILTQRGIADSLPEIRGQVVYLDADWPTIANHSGQDVTNVASKSSLAYVLFTSGSTGTPKGVGIEHRQLSNYLNAIVQQTPIM